jgi:SNF2 family DNA or RNA helicase
MQLYDWQQKELKNASIPKRALLCDPRVGKTLATLVALKHTEGVWDRLLVVAPKTVCPMWFEGLRKRYHRVWDLYSKPTRKVYGDEYCGAGVAVINWDRLYVLYELLCKLQFDFIVGDESHRAKSASAKQAKTFRKLCWRADRCRLLTGTVAPNHYGDVWGQFSCINPAPVEAGGFGKSYTKFRKHYLIEDMFGRVIGYNHLDELKERIAANACIVKREDVFGKDPYQEIIRKVTLPQKAYTLYRKLAKEWILDRATSGADITATHVLKRFGKLAQLAGGCLASDDGTKETAHKAKVDAALADLEEIIEAGQKVVIFHQYTWEGDLYAAELENAGYRWRRVYGETKDRNTHIDLFNKYDGGMVMIAQTDTMKEGVSLAEATHAFFVSMSYSWAQHKQARDRIFKPGCNRCVTYYLADRTVDFYIKRIVDGKKDLYNEIRGAELEKVIYGS